MRRIFLLFSVLFLLSSTLKAQTRIISGTVTGDKGETLPGVTIQVKGGNASTATDANGRYSIKVTDMQTVVIMVKYIGYAYQERAVSTNERNADFKLVPTTNDLNEVVVVGYGEQKKIHLTGAVATVDTKQIEDIPATDLASTLRGQLPGISINGGNTRPGIGNTSIVVRNPKFFSKDGSLTPLYIIDDVFRDEAAFNSLDQSEVESISVLKDAAAAIYGIAGANGAVVVRTKRGKAGAPKVTYSSTYGTSGVTELPHMLNGYQQAIFLNDYNATGQIANGHTIDAHGYIDGSATQKLRAYYTPDELTNFSDPANSTDWLRYAFKNSTMQRHTLNVSGGSEKATYFGSATYVKQISGFEGAKADRWTYRASADASVANGLKVAISLSGSISNDTKRYFKQGGESPDNDFKILTSAPMFTKFYYNGNPVLITGAGGNTSNSNLLENFNYFAATDLNDYTLSKPTVLDINPSVTYDVPFIKGLRLTANYNRQITNLFGKQVGTSYYAYQYAGLGENNHIVGGALLNDKVKQKNGDIVRLNPVFYNDYEFSSTISYNKKIGKHSLTFLGLYEQQEKYNEGVQAYVEGLLPGGYDNQNFAIGDMTSSQSTFISEYGRQAFAGRLNYNYDDKYLFEGLIRGDGSTKFAPGKRWGYFPSFSAGWIISQEGFFKDNVKFMDFLKLRGSIGFLGNDATKAWQYAENYNFGQQQKAAVFGGNDDRGLAIYQNIALANADVVWDNDTKMNLGLDMQFLKNRLSVTVDGYYDHRYNMLASLTSSTPLVVGATVPTENYAMVNSFGYELSASWKDQIGKDLSYYVSPWVAWNDNKILKVDQSAGIIGTYLDGIGYSDDRGVLGYKYAGFFRTQTQVDAYLADHPGYKINGQTPKPGMLYYEDIRGQKNTSAPGGYNGPDGIIDENDQTYLTNKENNHFSGGFNFGGSYKNFTLRVITTLGWGGQDAYESEALSPFKAYSNATAIANRPILWAPGNYWTYTNTDAALPSPYWISKNGGSNDLTSDFWFKSSFQFRMTNLNLSYALPKKIVNKLGVGSIRVYVNCVNPVNFYNPYNYRDNGVGTYETYPLVKSYTFGLNVGF